jgi:hypothetical protein
MSHFTELKCVSTFVVAIPATAKEEERMKLLSLFNSTVREVLIELRKQNANFLPLDVTTSVESIE